MNIEKRGMLLAFFLFFSLNAKDNAPFMAGIATQPQVKRPGNTGIVPPKMVTVQKLSQNAIEHIAQSIDDLISLFFETTTPKLKDILSKEDAQQIRVLLDKIKTVDWQKHNEQKSALIEESRKINKQQQKDEEEKEAKLDTEYPLIAALLSHDWESLPEHTTIKVSDFKEYQKKLNEIRSQKYKKISSANKALNEAWAKKYNLEEINEIDNLSTSITNIIGKYQYNNTGKISVDKNFWFNFLQQLLAKLIPNLQQILIKELELSAQ